MMNDIKKLWEEQLKGATSKIKRKQDWLEKELKQRSSMPQAGDIFIFKMPELTVGLQWVVLEADKENLLTVPADDAPMVGSTDVQLPDNALCSPLTLRCDQMLAIHKDKFDIDLRVGVLDEWHRLRALKKRDQILEKKFRIRLQRFITIILRALHSQLPKLFYSWFGDITQLRSSVLHQAMNYEPDYVDWMRQVSRERQVLIDKFAPPREDSWIKKLIKKTSDWFSDTFSNTQRIVLAMAVVLILIVGLLIIMSPQIKAPSTQTIIAELDSSYQAFNNPPVEELRDFQFAWEVSDQSNHFAFSPTQKQASLATQAFGAGLLMGRETLLSQSPPAESWSETEWKISFDLGRWTFLLWTVSQSQEQVPATFWDDQRKIFAQFKAVFVDRAESKKVARQLKIRIQPFLDKLPADSDNFGFELEKMMSFLTADLVEDKQ